MLFEDWFFLKVWMKRRKLAVVEGSHQLTRYIASITSWVSLQFSDLRSCRFFAPILLTVFETVFCPRKKKIEVVSHRLSAWMWSKMSLIEATRKKPHSWVILNVISGHIRYFSSSYSAHWSHHMSILAATTQVYDLVSSMRSSALLAMTFDRKTGRSLVLVNP